jgi:DNA-binding response OmpR family regulator
MPVAVDHVEGAMSQILVVSNDHTQLVQTVSILRGAGYHARGASTFEDASRLLKHRPPDLVIADECLGDFNGLHIIMRARARHPDVLAIVTSPVKSRGLEADARSLNVECMLKPRDPAEWVASVSKTLRVEADAGSSCSDRLASCVTH